MPKLLRDVIVAFAIGGLLGGGLALAYADEDVVQKDIRECRAAGGRVLVSKCGVTCLNSDGRDAAGSR
jgi:hypothetical protein